VTEGAITIDGVDIRHMTQHSLRNQIGVVFQDAHLFNDTVRANIAYGRPQATHAEVEAAAKAAHAHDFIMNLPAGYDTIVRERGTRLSGGQRQRIAIARAFLKNAPILLLDEATSSLDTDSEEAIREALNRLMQGRTVIAIAHRLSTLRNFDRIVVIKDGKVIENGAPSALIATGGHFSRLLRKEENWLTSQAA
jgi:ABC-type multidrug transport system fused ATPase/permease subunit